MLLFTTWIGMLSKPELLVFFNFLTIVLISSGLTGARKMLSKFVFIISLCFCRLTLFLLFKFIKKLLKALAISTGFVTFLSLI